MKFPEKYTAKSSTLHINSLKSGLNLSQNPYESDNKSLSACKNVWFNNGVLCQRPGIGTKADSLIYNNQYRNAFYNYYKTTDIEVTIDGTLMKLVIEEIDYDMSNYLCLSHFINSDGVICQTATMRFSRVSDDIFYIPDNIVFYKGKPTQGGGIYALIHLVNTENYSENESRIYEIDESFSSWDIVLSQYIPTVYINGRGNQYEIAATTGQAFGGTPMKPEKLNIFSDTFYSYYSTDGSSSSFRLPFANLNPKGITARLYFSVSDYVEWSISEGENSVVATLYDTKVTMTVNYKKGIVSFSYNSQDYNMPLITDRNENNLRIMAHKSAKYSPNDLSVAVQAKNVNSKILLAAKNRIFAADYDRPLYFPSEAGTIVGEGDTPISAMTVSGNNIVLFQKNMTFLLTLSRGRAINSTSLLAENDAVFYESDQLNVKLISQSIGCPDKDSIVSHLSNIYWRANDGQFYSISGTGNISNISQSVYSLIDNNFNNNIKTIGVKYGNFLLFIEGNKAMVLQTDEKQNNAWYYWEFPQNLLFEAVFYFDQTPYFICTNTDNYRTFVSSFHLGCDQLLRGNFFDPEIEEHPIQLLIKTIKFPLGCANTLKKVNFVAMQIKAKTATVYINNRLVADICRHNDTNQFESLKLLPALCPVDTLQLEITTEDALELGGIDINYTELNLL